MIDDFMTTGPVSGDEFSREQVERMLVLYARTLDDLGYPPAPYPNVDEPVTGSILRGAKYDSLCHARLLCDETRRFMREGRFSKAYRWIGMVQGLLFMGGVFSIRQLKQHNRS
jgi:hypothetical protein